MVFCFVSFFSSIPSHKEIRYREKLGTKAVKEEFHAEQINGTWVYKRYYGWNSLNASVWLPSVSELVGIDPDNYYEPYGTYYSAMQGLNTSENHHADMNGGNQFAYFTQYNTSGGGDKIWNACRQEETWLRSTPCWRGDVGWRISNTTDFGAPLVTLVHAVHPAGNPTQINQASKMDWFRSCAQQASVQKTSLGLSMSARSTGVL